MMWTTLLLALTLASPLPAADPTPNGKSFAEKEVSDAEIARTYERARRAQAHCDVQNAAAEWRKILRYHQSGLKRVKRMCARGVCCSVDTLRNAEGAVAVAQARLAEVEGRKSDLQAELPRVIEFYEARMREIQNLLLHRAISDKDAQQSLKELREELRWARKRLTSLRGDSSTQDSPGHGSRP